MSILEKIKGLNKPFNIYADTNLVEHGALQQFADAMEQPFATRGALMPDVHQGYSLPIGGVVETDGVVVPSWVGYDIGCGMCAAKTTFKYEDIDRFRFDIRDLIYERIPVGFNKRGATVLQANEAQDMMKDATEATRLIYHEKQGHLQLGTLGGGNHFIEIGKDQSGFVWIVIHSGSRGVGHGVATHYIKKADPQGKCKEGHHGFDVELQDGKDYIKDMNFCLDWALLNRKVMVYEVVNIIQEFTHGGISEAIINRNHNHAESKDGQYWIHRKGATHAEDGMLGVIPGNMRDGSFIVVGKGNEGSLQSSSHGAGRVLGRKAAKRDLNVEDFQDTMKGIVAPVDYERLDESPFAYKDIYEVMDNQKDLVEVIAHETPIIVIKG